MVDSSEFVQYSLQLSALIAYKEEAGVDKALDTAAAGNMVEAPLVDVETPHGLKSEGPDPELKTSISARGLLQTTTSTAAKSRIRGLLFHIPLFICRLGAGTQSQISWQQSTEEAGVLDT